MAETTIDPLAPSLDLGLGGPPPPMAPMPAPPALSSFLPKPGLGEKLAPLAILAAALIGGKKTSGLAQGYTEGQRHLEAQNLQQAQIAHADAIRQQQALQLQQHQHEVLAQQEESRRMGALNTIKTNVSKITDRGLYDQMIEGYAAQMQQAGFRGVTSNGLRLSAPFVAPSAKDIAGKAVNAWLKNPANAAALRKDPSMVGKVYLRIDTNGDGVEENVPLVRAGALGGVQFATDEQGAPIAVQSDAPIGDKFKELYSTKLARFVADNKRQPEPKEKEQLIKDAIKQGAEEQRSPQDEVDPLRVVSTAQAILQHRMAPSQLSLGGGTMGKSPFRQAVMAEVNKQNPQFNWQEAESNYQFGKSASTQNTVRYLDNIKTSMGVLRQASKDFSRTDVKVLNRALAEGEGQFGGTTVAVYNMARNIVADEIAKTMQGGGTGNATSDAKMRQALKMLDQDYSQKQLTAVLDAADLLLGGRRETLTKGTYMEQPKTPTPPPAEAPWTDVGGGIQIRKKKS